MAEPGPDPQEFLETLESFLDKDPPDETLQLEGLRRVLSRLEDNGNEGVTQRAFELLATAAGAEEEWRDLFRRSGFLNSAINGLNFGTPQDPVPSHMVGLAKQCLRLIGNCVVDNDTNREEVIPDFSLLVNCLREPQLVVTSLIVMMNVCNDYDPAQFKAAEMRLDQEIVAYLKRDEIPEEAIGYAIDLLIWTVEKLTSDKTADEAVDISTFRDMLQIALRASEEHLEDYGTVIALYLQDTRLQGSIAADDHGATFADLLRFTRACEARMDDEDILTVFGLLSRQQSPDDYFNEDSSIVLAARLVYFVSIIPTSDAFSYNFDEMKQVLDNIRPYFSMGSPVAPSLMCVCVTLANLATSDEISIYMVEKEALHIRVLEILTTEKAPALLYPAAGFMRHLSFPQRNRTVLVEAGVIQTCCHLLLNDDPSVRGEAAAILNKLVSDSLQNIELVTRKPFPDDITVDQEADAETHARPTILQHIVTQALAPSAPLPSLVMKNPMMEIAWMIIGILRSLGHNKSNTETNFQKLSSDIFKTPLLARPVTQLVRQRFFNTARSDGLLGLGLMATSPEGAVCVVKELEADDGLLNEIKELAAASGGEQGQDIARNRDRQNAVFLLHALMENAADTMTTPLKDAVGAMRQELLGADTTLVEFEAGAERLDGYLS